MFHSGEKCTFSHLRNIFFFLVFNSFHICLHTRQWGGGQTGKDVSWFQGWESGMWTEILRPKQWPTYLLGLSANPFQTIFTLLKPHESELPGVKLETSETCVAPGHFPWEEQHERDLWSTARPVGEVQRLSAGTRVVQGCCHVTAASSFGPEERLKEEQSTHSARCQTKWFLLPFLSFCFLNTLDKKQWAKLKRMYLQVKVLFSYSFSWCPEKWSVVVCAYTVSIVSVLSYRKRQHGGNSKAN